MIKPPAISEPSGTGWDEDQELDLCDLGEEEQKAVPESPGGTGGFEEDEPPREEQSLDKYAGY